MGSNSSDYTESVGIDPGLGTGRMNAWNPTLSNRGFPLHAKNGEKKKKPLKKSYQNPAEHNAI